MTLKYTNSGSIPIALAVFLATEHYDDNPDPNTISTTTLLRPLRQIILPSRIPPGEALPDLADLVASRLGTAIHNGIEDAWKNNYRSAMEALGMRPNIIDRVRINPKKENIITDVIPFYLEQRLSRKLGKWTVTGKFDFVGDGKVQDFKNTTVWAYQNQVGAIKYPEQGSIYRWLNPEIITKDIMEIHYILTDWKAAFVRSDPKYPHQRCITQKFNLTSLQATEASITAKLDLIDKYWDADEETIPHCTAEELWRSTPQFKYYKNGDINSSRSTKNFDTNQAAVIHMTSIGKGAGAIKEVPGQVTACKYCPAFAACTQKDALIASGELVLGN